MIFHIDLALNHKFAFLHFSLFFNQLFLCFNRLFLSVGDSLVDYLNTKKEKDKDVALCPRCSVVSRMLHILNHLPRRQGSTLNH